jgi:RsiW-degrading membrane proteinase PrsW (M82 family)
MTRVAALLSGWLLAAGGCAMFGLYLLMIFGRAGEVEQRSDAAAAGGFGLSLLAAGLVLLAAVARWREQSLVRSVRFPTTWSSLLVLGAALGAGAYAARSERWPLLDVLLAALAVAAVLAFFGRLGVRWGSRRSVDGWQVLGPGAWGMAAAPLIAVLLQLGAFLTLSAAVLGGLYLADADLMSAARERGISDIIDSESNFVSRATVAIALAGTYALIAPLTEELAKFLGVLVFLRRRPLTRYAVFAAGVSAGLGFAVVETLAYGLSAGDLWPLVVGFRAPVTLVHIAGATLCALGWYEQRKRGGLRLLWYYAIAVAVHGSWNGLTVAAVVGASAIDEAAGPDVGTVLLLLNVLLMMATLLACCALWTVLNARRFGKEAAWHEEPSSPPRLAHELAMERGPVLTGVAAGKV